MENNFFERAKRTLESSDEIARESIPFLDELGLTSDEIKWIGKVKKASEGATIDDLIDDLNPTNKSWKKGEERDRRENPMTAFDLVRVHLMLLRDLKKFGPDFVGEKTEKELDGILSYIIARKGSSFLDEKIRYEIMNRPINQRSYRGYDEAVARAIDDYSKAKNGLDKAAVLTRLLNIWHTVGGQNAVFGSSGIHHGVPKKFRLNPGYEGEDAYDFLNELNNLGKKPA